MVSERPDSRRCAAGWFTLFVVLMCCLCLVTTVAATAGAEETRDTKGGKTLGDGYDPEEMRELRKNLEELQEDVQAILKRVQHSEELYVEANNTMTWLEWLLGAETEEPAPEAPMGPSEACRNFYECFGACTVMALRMAKLVWLSFMTPLLGEKAEWVRAVVSTYLPMNNFIEVIRSLCLLSMCYRILRAITPDPVFELLIRMILSPFTLTRVIVWSIVDVLGSVCFKEAWDNLKEYWEKENPNADEDTTDTRGRREPNRTPRCEGQAKTDEGASLKDFCPSKSIVRSKKDLTNLMEDVKFQIGDDFARIHALLRSLDSTDAATARFAAFVRKECAKIIKTETLPQSSKRARSCGIKVKDMWGKVATRAHEYFTATGGDIFASLRELQGLRKEAGEDLSQYIARFTSTWANLEPPVPESKAIEVILPVLPRDFAKLMSAQSIHETTLAKVAQAYRNYNEWSVNAQQQQIAQTPQRRSGHQGQGRVQQSPVHMQHSPQYGQPPSWLKTMRCHQCGRFGHMKRDCPLLGGKGRIVQEVNVSGDFDGADGPCTAHQEQEVQPNQPPSRAQPEAPTRVYHDEGSDDEGHTARNESVSVFSVAKTGTPFIAKKIHITFQITDKRGKSQPVKTLIDTGSCANIISFSALQKMGYTQKDLLRDHHGVPTKLVGFAGEDELTLGGIILRTGLGNVERETQFVVVNNVLTQCIIGMPAITDFGLHICGRQRSVSF